VSEDVLLTQADGGRHVLLPEASGRIGKVVAPLRPLVAGLGYGRYGLQGVDCAPPLLPQIGWEGRPARNRATILWPARRKHARPDVAHHDRQGFIGWKPDCRCLTNAMFSEGSAGSTPSRGRSDLNQRISREPARRLPGDASDRGAAPSLSTGQP
jgi:hypothetical protein